MVSASALTQAEELQSPLTKAAARCVLVLFGASGDLTKRKLVPALFNLAKAKLLPDNFAILGVAFDDLTLEQFRDQVTSFLHADENTADTLRSFRQRLYYQRANFGDAAMYPPFKTALSNSTFSTTPKAIIFFIWRLRRNSLAKSCSS